MKTMGLKGQGALSVCPSEGKGDVIEGLQEDLKETHVEEDGGRGSRVVGG